MSKIKPLQPRIESAINKLASIICEASHRSGLGAFGSESREEIKDVLRELVVAIKH